MTPTSAAISGLLGRLRASLIEINKRSSYILNGTWQNEKWLSKLPRLLEHLFFQQHEAITTTKSHSSLTEQLIK